MRSASAVTSRRVCVSSAASPVSRYADGVPSPETETQLEGALNLWRYKGRAALAIVALVTGFFVFTYVDAKTDPAPTTPAPTYQHTHFSGPNSNEAPPSFVVPTTG